MPHMKAMYLPFHMPYGSLVCPHKLQSDTVCPKVPVNSNVVDFSAISGPILNPFDLQVATLGRFDIMYNMP